MSARALRRVSGGAIVAGQKAWLDSSEGKRCLDGTTSGEYLRNRLLLAFVAGVTLAEEAFAAAALSPPRAGKRRRAGR